MSLRKELIKLNMVTLASTEGDKAGFYQAWLQNEISFKADNKTQDLIGDLKNVGISLLANAAGYVPAFDMPRKFTYGGTDYTSLTLNTLLRLNKDGVQKCFVDPLKNLAEMAFPQRSQTKLPMADIGSGLLNLVGTGSGPVTSLVSKFAQTFKKIAEETYIMDVPKQITDAVPDGIFVYYGSLSAAQQVPIRLGPYFIKSVEVILGKLIMDGGVPETVKVNIQLESMRKAIASDFATIFQGVSIPPSGEEATHS